MQKKIDMCTVQIKIDEAKMRRINPGLTTTESIGEWLQNQINELIDDYMSDLSLPPCSHTREEMMEICNQRMEDILSGRASTIPHDEVMRRMKEKYGLAL